MSTPNYQTQKKYYSERSQKYSTLAEGYRSTSIRLSFMRLAILLAMIGGLYLLKDSTLYIVVAWIIAAIILFLYVVVRHRRSDRLQHKAQILRDINGNELAILEGEANSYHNGERYQVKRHAYAHDLDVLGDRSMYHQMNRTKTYHGGHQLSQWLMRLDDNSTMAQRQEAVKELERDLDWCQELAYRLYGTKDEISTDPTQDINTLLSQDLSFLGSPIPKYGAALLPFLWITLAVAYFFYPDVVERLALWLAGFSLLTGIYYAKRVGHIQSNVSAALRSLGPIDEALQHIFSRDYESEYINELLRPLRSAEQSHTVASLSKLKRIIDFLDYRLNMLVGVVLNILLLWDLRVLKMLAEWKDDYSHSIDEIFELIGRVEGLMSLATWAYHHNQFDYGTIDDSGTFVVEGQGLHHPLLVHKHSIANSITINEVDHITIITGSNMAGKSTFLRTIGCNMLLTYAGTRTTGESLRISPVELLSYMRIKDDLEESTSTFKAELNRVAMILDHVKQEGESLVLIDEMLRGTNSVDKLTGSIAITKKLLEHRTHAMIATHDIQLAELESTEPDHIQNFFFDIALRDGELEFDYKLKDGICNTFNASFLLRQLDLDVNGHDRGIK